MGAIALPAKAVAPMGRSCRLVGFEARLVLRI